MRYQQYLHHVVATIIALLQIDIITVLKCLMILTNPMFALDSCCFKIYHIYKSQISLCWPQYCIHRTLQPGDEILDNYGYHYAVMPKEERQRKLYNQYYFTCACQSCNSNWPVYSSLSQVSNQENILKNCP